MSKTYKKYSVLLLSSSIIKPDYEGREYVDYISKDLKNNTLLYGRSIFMTNLINPHYLYFLSDDKIKIGDWAYHNLDGKVIQIDGNLISGDIRRFGYRKVVATNDRRVRFASGEMYPEWFYLPSLSKDFIEDYVDNNGVGFEQVEVEQTLSTYEDWIKTGEAQPKFKIKVLPNGELVIKTSKVDPIKDLSSLLGSFKHILKYYPLQDKEIALSNFEEIISDLKELLTEN